LNRLLTFCNQWSSDNLIWLPSYIIQGGKILLGGSGIESEGNFVQPTIVEISPDAPVVKEELFGPVLYVMKFQVAKKSIFVCYWPAPCGIICRQVSYIIVCPGCDLSCRPWRKQLKSTILSRKDWAALYLQGNQMLFSNGLGKFWFNNPASCMTFFLVASRWLDIQPGSCSSTSVVLCSCLCCNIVFKGLTLCSSCPVHQI
jgi:hypothetical protein